jgi:hypothetical protein
VAKVAAPATVLPALVSVTLPAALTARTSMPVNAPLTLNAPPDVTVRLCGPVNPASVLAKAMLPPAPEVRVVGPSRVTASP